MFQCNMVVNLEVEATETQSVLTPIVTFVNSLWHFTAAFLAMHIQISFLLQGLFLKTGKSVIFLQISSKNKNLTQSTYIGIPMYENTQRSSVVPSSHTHVRPHTYSQNGREKNSLLNFNIKSHFFTFLMFSHLVSGQFIFLATLSRKKKCERIVGL